MTKTANYQLNQWEASDKLSRADFNSDNAAIDAALGALATSVAASGNCKIAWGSYTGNGTYGEENAVTLEFDFKPMMIVIGSDTYAFREVGPTVLIRGRTKGTSDAGTNGASDNVMRLSWTDTSASWYSTTNPAYQCNLASTTYYYVAFGVNE